MKLAIIADIHGNSGALAAVLADISRHHPDRLVQLGDAFNGPIDPPGVVKLLRSQRAVHIIGNGDRMVLSEDQGGISSSARYARSMLSPSDLEWVASWKETHRESIFFACHGSPRSDEEYLLEEVTSNEVCLRTSAQIENLVQEISQPLILCGHSHIPRMVRLSTGALVVNPGSVGLPAYCHDKPFPHHMQTGSPHARYAIVEKVEGTWAARFVAVEYDWETAAKAALSLGCEEWAHALQTGYAV